MYFKFVFDVHTVNTILLVEVVKILIKFNVFWADDMPLWCIQSGVGCFFHEWMMKI